MKAGAPESGLVVGAPNVPTWRVLEVVGDVVTYECAGRSHSVSVSTWRRNVESRNLRAVDTNEEAARRNPSPRAERRDMAALRAIVGAAGDGGWTHAPIGSLCATSGLTRSAWKRAVESLAESGAIEVSAGDFASRRATAYRATDLARELVDEGGAGRIVVTLPADPAHAARVLRAIADALAPSVPAEPQAALHEPPRPVPVPPATPPVLPPVGPPALPPVDHRASLGRIVEVWTYELQLPASRATGCESSWAAIHADTRPAPTADVVIAALKRESPKWHARAAECRRQGDRVDPWRWTPKLRGWLEARGWEAAPDPVPRDGPAQGPALSSEAKARIEELRQKAADHERVGDHAMARDYRRLVDKIRETGVIP